MDLQCHMRHMAFKAVGQTRRLRGAQERRRRMRDLHQREHSGFTAWWSLVRQCQMFRQGPRGIWCSPVQAVHADNGPGSRQLVEGIVSMPTAYQMVVWRWSPMSSRRMQCTGTTVYGLKVLGIPPLHATFTYPKALYAGERPSARGPYCDTGLKSRLGANVACLVAIVVSSDK